MENKIPTWVLFGTVVLAFSAGILNTTALMGFTHISASHVTGNVSQVAVAVFESNWIDLKLFIISIGSFWFGSVLSGMIVGGSELNINRNYGYAMYLQFILLCGSLGLYLHGNEYGQMLIAAACGVQNSMVTTYHGAVVRTTHLTGVTSDLGATVGHWLAGRKVNKYNILLLSGLWWGFFIGGFVAVWLYAKIGYLSMLLPMSVILFSAMTYQRMERWYTHSQKLVRVQRIKYKSKRKKTKTKPKPKKERP
ncbi:MAG: YoaK family protein [Moraxella sp.]|nr:YoaK family protein [Moraxella sp.]